MIVSTWSVSKKRVKESACWGFWVVIIIDLYKEHAASYQYYSIFSTSPVWRRSFLHLISPLVISSFILAVTCKVLNNQFSLSLSYSVFLFILSFLTGDYNRA